MPEAESDRTSRSGRLLTGVFWFGVGLAPLAGLLLLVGGQGTLRVAGVLAVLSVVLIGLSIALRPDIGQVRLQLEETLLDEIDALREDVREELATATRDTHQTFGERIGAIQQQVEALRVNPPVVARPAIPAAPAPPPIGRAQFPAPAAVAPPYSVAPPQAAPVRSAVPAPPPYVPPAPAPSAPPAGRQPPVSAPAANGRAAVGAPGAGRRANGAPAARHQAEAPRRAPAGRANVPGGVYRRTETVQVTRSTYVDEGTPPPRDRGYDTGFQRRADDSQEWSPPVPRSRNAEPPEESWTDQKLRERYGGRRSRLQDTNGGGSWGQEGERYRPISAEPVSGEVITGEPVSAEPRGRRSHRWEEDDSTGLRISERWAAVRSDERGQELRVGERRAARHSDDSGSELRIEDRWAAVRREDDGRGTGRRRANGRESNGRESNGREANGRHSAGRESNGSGRSDPGRSAGYGRPDYGRPALPAGGSEPSWNDSWEESTPVRESRGRRSQEESTGGRGYSSAPRQRRLDFELSDERWR